MRRPNVIVLIGTGAFARAFAKALLPSIRTATQMVVLGRSAARVEAMRDLVQHQAACAGDLVAVQAIALDLGLHSDLRPWFAKLRPRIVIVCSSLHSPYEIERCDHAWARFLASVEFGMTGPLQAALAVRAAEAIAAEDLQHCCLVNGCYPDFVNALVSALGLPILCGLGNVATLTAGMERLAATDHGHKMQMLAHHRHLKSIDKPEDEARLWIDGAPSPDLPDWLARLRGWPRQDLNDLGAAAGGRLVGRLLAGETVEASLPGVRGLSGGYPVVVNMNECKLDLPPGVSLDATIEWQERHAEHEGIVVTAARTIRFTGRTATDLQALGVISRAEVPVAAWGEIVERLLVLREAMRGQGAPVHA